MKKATLPIFAVLVSLLLFSVQSEKWIKFKSKKGKFEIMFPGKPTGSDQSAETMVGDIKIHMDMYETIGGAWGVSYNDYPEALVDGQDGHVLLNEALGGATTSMGLDITEMKKEGTYQGYPSLDFKGYSTESGFHNTYRLILKKNRLYQIMALGSDTYLPRAQEFLDSFKMKK